MNTQRAWLLLSLLTLSCSEGPAPGPSSAVLDRDRAVREIVQIETVEWARASAEGDIAWFERHLADELTMTTGRTGAVTTKADELAAIEPSEGGPEEIDDLKVQVHGNVAVATFKIDTTGHDETGPYHRIARYTEVWLHRDGRWQLVASHSSLVPGS